MCLATPIQIQSIDKDIAVVEHDGKKLKVSLQLVPNAKVGDWLLAHGDIAINTIPENEALGILKLIQTANSTD
jgi:hydrogenase expression/formation protein HypC